MAVNLSALSNVSTTALTLSNLILVTPKSNYGIRPQNGRVLPDKLDKSKPLPAILFHYESEQSVTLQSDITDHFAEDNATLQDHISLRPETITTQGYIGELNDAPPEILQPLRFAADKLSIVSDYTPQLSVTAQKIYNEAAFAYSIAANAANSAVSTWNTLTNPDATQSVINGSLDKNGKSFQEGTVQNKQQEAFIKFYGYWKSRTLFTVQTPWAIFENCAIMSLRAVQDGESTVVSSFEVTFKVMRFARVLVNDTNSSQGRNAALSSHVIDKGSATPVNTSDTIQNRFFERLGIA